MTLLFGDCRQLLETIEPGSVDAVVTDPPYGIGSRDPRWAEVEAYLSGDLVLDTGGDVIGTKWSLPCVGTWRAVYRTLRKGGLLAVFASPRNMDLVVAGIRAAGFRILPSSSWVQVQGSGINRHVLKPSWEPIILASKGRARKVRLPAAIYAPKVKGADLIHPTIKPLGLVRQLVEALCPERGLVLDPYVGSGTTAIAAHLSDRRWIGIEREPKFYRLARKRLSRVGARLHGPVDRIHSRKATEFVQARRSEVISSKAAYAVTPEGKVARLRAQQRWRARVAAKRLTAG